MPQHASAARSAVGRKIFGLSILSLALFASVPLLLLSAPAKSPQDRFGVSEDDRADAVKEANRGWEKVGKAEPRQALDHYLAALKLDPENRAGREGLAALLGMPTKLSSPIIAVSRTPQPPTEIGRAVTSATGCIRITQSNWLNAEVGGDRGTVKLVSDDMAREAVEVHQIAEYAPEYDQPAPSWSAGDAQEIPAVRKNGPSGEQAAEMMQQGLTPEQAADQLTQLSEELGLYDDPSHQRWEDAAEPGDIEPYAEPEMTMPSAKDSRGAWAKWARHQDPQLSPQKAAALTKGQLMATYGERL